MKQTAEQVYERYMMLAQGFIVTDEARYDKPYILDRMDYHRGIAIQQIWIKGNKAINPLWLQPYTPQYSEDLQESNCYVLFECPPFITLDDASDGLISVFNGFNRIPRVRTQSELNTYSTNRLTKNITKCFWESEILEVYGDALMLENINYEGLWLQPTRLPTFNVSEDLYPACQMVLSEMEQMWLQDLKMAKPLDYVPDTQEAVAQQ